MRSISLRDLKLADCLKHLNEIEIIHPSNDELVKSVLEQIGFNTKQGIDYIPSNHRDMKQHAAVGFQVIGEYNVDPKYNKYIDTIDRCIVAGLTDISLAKDMAGLMGRGYNYRNEDEFTGKINGRKKQENDPRYYTDQELLDMGFSEGDDDEDDYYEIEDSCEDITRQIEELQTVKELVRGCK